MPGCEERGLAVRGQSDAVDRLGVRQGGADRLLQCSEREARVDRLPDVDAIRSSERRVGKPERKLHPLADLLLEEKLVRDPRRSRVARRDRATALEELRECDSGMGGVVCAALPRLAERDRPLGEVAHVDHLRGAFGRAGRENLSTTGEAVRPVREAAGGVVWPDDEPRRTTSACAPNMSRTALSESAFSAP